MKRLLFLAVILLLCANILFSLDFGLLAEQKFEWEQEKTFTYSPLFTPWFSWEWNNGFAVYASLHFPLKYRISDDDSNDYGWGTPGFKFEFSRTSLSYTGNPNFSVEAGRVMFSDNLAVTSFGLFDGVHYQMPLPIGNLSAGFFYTGLLYKETAKILMTGTDIMNYAEEWDRNMRYYFASRRLFGAGRLDMPFLEYHNLSFEAIFQFDCNAEEDWLHSQYFQAQIEFFTSKKIGLTGGVFFETMQADDDFSIAFGGLGIVRIDLPTPLNDGLKVSSKFCSGEWNDAFSAFNPISSQSQGEIFPEPFSGISVTKVNYDVRILPSLFAELSMSYFLKTTVTPDDKKIFYGGEFWTAVAWQPFDDLRGTFGAGVFFPRLGNVYPDDTDPLWKISVGVAISF